MPDQSTGSRDSPCSVSGRVPVGRRSAPRLSGESGQIVAGHLCRLFIIHQGQQGGRQVGQDAAISQGQVAGADINQRHTLAGMGSMGLAVEGSAICSALPWSAVIKH